MHTINLKVDDLFNDILADYIDEELDNTELRVFKEYLTQAEAKRNYVSDVKKGKKALDKLPKVTAADDFEEKLFRRIAMDKELSIVEEEL